MRQTFLYSLLLILTIQKSYGQQHNDIFSLRLGYSSTNIIFKEAFEPSFQFFGYILSPGKTFAGDGIEFGASKDINKNMLIDIGFSTFTGSGTRSKVNNNENLFNLKGYQIPLTANYLLRKIEKRFRINIGVGFQYLVAHLQQFESVSTSIGQITNQITDINISEFQFALRPGIQYRIIPNLFVSFIVKVAMSTNGRYSDNPCLSLKYAFTKKK